MSQRLGTLGGDTSPRRVQSVASVRAHTKSSHLFVGNYKPKRPQTRSGGEKSLMFSRPLFRTSAPRRITQKTYSRLSIFSCCAFKLCLDESSDLSTPGRVCFFILPTSLTLWRIRLSINHFQTGGGGGGLVLAKQTLKVPTVHQPVGRDLRR